MGNKKCTQCKEDKSLDQFVKVGFYKHSMCNDCRLEYYKKNNRRITKLKNQKLW